MTPRQWLKHRLYGPRGRFPYFGVDVHFPPGSLAFRAACAQGIFEADNLKVLHAVCYPRTTVFDVGGNLGLMAIPLLRWRSDCTVVSFEPSPNSLPYLRATMAASGFGDRWRLIEKAVGDTVRTAEFSVSRRDDALYDGLKSTGRAAASDLVTVDVTTLDRVWDELGRPAVSAIKIDVEGAELDVLRGGRQCIAANRPSVLLEWNATNLSAYAIQARALVEIAREIDYKVFAIPTMVPVTDADELQTQMIVTESFLLRPADSARVGVRILPQALPK